MSPLSQNSDVLQGAIPLNIKAEVVLVTVAMAKIWLSTMIPNQRKPSMMTVKKYASEMKVGQWEVSTALSFNDDGRLIDGQHRLLAVIESEVPTHFLTIGNLPKSAALKFDIGRKRTATNIAHIDGHNWITTRHLSCYIAMFISPTTHSHPPLTSHQDKVEGILKHKDAIEFAGSKLSGIWLNACFTSVIARAYYSQNHQRLAEFLEVLSTGICETKEDQAAVVLREIWLRKSKRFDGGANTRHKLISLTTNALRRFIKREKVKTLLETTENCFPVKDFDQWWKDRYEDVA